MLALILTCTPRYLIWKFKINLPVCFFLVSFVMYTHLINHGEQNLTFTFTFKITVEVIMQCASISIILQTLNCREVIFMCNPHNKPWGETDHDYLQDQRLKSIKSITVT